MSVFARMIPYTRHIFADDRYICCPECKKTALRLDEAEETPEPRRLMQCDRCKQKFVVLRSVIYSCRPYHAQER